MLDTIELLETVGSNASLRHLDEVDMAQYFMDKGAVTLPLLKASTDLRAAVVAQFGDRNREPNGTVTPFFAEIGSEMMSDLKVHPTSC